METLIPLLIIVIIIGALLGGKSLGETVRIGCGVLIMLIIIAFAIGLFFYSGTDSQKTYENHNSISTSDNSAHFIVNENCQTYIKPNIESDESGNLEIGDEYFVKNINKFNYFYEITDKNGHKAFVRKECLKRK